MLKQTSQGFTLVELMVALALALVFMSSMVAVFTTGVYHSRQAVDAARLQQSMQAAMALIVSDVRRSGYWGNAKTAVSSNSNNNPFMQSATNLTVNGTNDCILFAYDHDSNGSVAAVGTSSDDEHYGYRLLGGAIQARPISAGFNCTGAVGAWDNVTDPTLITISQLQFTQTTSTIAIPGTTHTIKVRFVTISMTGSLVKNASTTLTLTDKVRVRNDLFTP